MANYVSQITPSSGSTYDIRELYPHIGTCGTAAATSAKTVTIGNFKLYTGAWVVVKFTYTNTAAAPGLTLNVDNTGPKSIKYKNADLTDVSMLAANKYTYFMYDGTNYQIIEPDALNNKVTQTPTSSSNTSYRPIILGNDYASAPESYTGTEKTETTYAVNTALIKPSTGDIFTKGSITLYAASGDSPALIFQRGTMLDNTVDWKIYDTGGKLNFDRNQQGSSVTWNNILSLDPSNSAMYFMGNNILHAGNYTSYTYSATASRTANTVLAAPNGSNGAATFRKLVSADMPTNMAPYEAYLKWGGKDFSGSYGPLDAALSPRLGANRMEFTRSAGITIERSTDSGTTWTAVSDISNTNKTGLFTTPGYSVWLSATSTAGIGTDAAKNMMRVTVATADSLGRIYTALNKFIMYVGTGGATGMYVKIRIRLQSDVSAGNDTWKIWNKTSKTWVATTDASATDANTKCSLSGWSGFNVINVSAFTTYGNSPASQYGNIQFIFGCANNESTYSGAYVISIQGYGGMGWTTPSNMALTGHLYSYDYSQNAQFPANVGASKFIGPLQGNADTATTATNANNVYTTVTNGTSSTSRYGVLFVADPNTSEANTVRKTNDFRINLTNGTTSTTGQAELVLGNANAKNTADNKQGYLTLYSPGTSYHMIGTTETSSVITHTFPAVSGTLINTGNYKDYATPHLGNLTSVLGQGTPASTTKTYFDTDDVRTGGVSTAYNSNGVEWSLLFSKGASINYGTVLKWSYTDKYIYTLRKYQGEWKSDDWEKISAGYADTAGSATSATSATTASKLSTSTAGSVAIPVYFSGGIPIPCQSPASGSWYPNGGAVPYITGSGVLELGPYIDFHATNASTNNYDMRLYASSTSVLDLYSQSQAPTLRIISDAHTSSSLEFIRTGDSYVDYRITNDGGTFRIQSDYDSSHVNWFDMLSIAYTTGNAVFKGTVTSTKFIGPLQGNADTATSATKATGDESGNNIKATYAASFSISDHTITLKNKNGTSLGTVTVPDNNTTYGISGAYGDSNNNTWKTTITAGGTGTSSTVPTASTSAYGITKLYNGVDSTSTSMAATANAVKTAYDKANHSHNYLPLAGGTMNTGAAITVPYNGGNIEYSGGGITVTAPTASGWARGFDFNANSTYCGGIGARGDANAFSHFYIGLYSDPIVKLYPDKSTYFYGTVHLKANQYELNPVASAMNCHNSNITGVNAVIFEDDAGPGEALMFWRSSTTWDSVWASSGELYFTPNYPTNTTNRYVIHTGNLSTYVKASSTNGKLNVNGSDVTVYTHPAQTSKSSGLYKITVDGTGHVSAATAATSSDLPSHTHTDEDIDHSTTYRKNIYTANPLNAIMRLANHRNRANKLAFLPYDKIDIKYSTNGGSSWTDAGVSDATKAKLFTGIQSESIYIGPNNSTTTRTTSMKTQITITSERAIVLDQLYLLFHSNSHGLTVDVKGATYNKTDYDSHKYVENFAIGSWTYNSVLNMSSFRFQTSESDSSHISKLQITFSYTSVGSGDSPAQLFGILGYGGVDWWTSSSGPNNMAMYDHIYRWNENKETIFPADIYVGSTKVSLVGHTHSNYYDTGTTRTANTVLAGPTSGSAASATFRSLVKADIPALDYLSNTTKYAGSSSQGGAATSANKLNTNDGSATQPVYFSNGIPVATTYALNKTVPSNAVFTDTTYTLSGAYGSSSNTWITTLTPSSGTATTSIVPTASTSVYGITKLSDSVTSTSTSLAATANAVKTAYDKGNHSHPYLADTTKYALSGSVGGTALRSNTLEVVATNEVRFYNDNQMTKNKHFWFGFQWATGSHYTPDGGSDTQSTTTPNITKYIMGNCSGGYLADVQAKNFLIGNGSNPSSSSSVTTLVGTGTENRTISFPDKNGTVALTNQIFAFFKDYYSFDSTALPTSFDYGLTVGFVKDDAGYGNYGSVLNMRTYSAGGASLQLYVPYSPTYGGTRLKCRFGNYAVSSGNSWTDLKELAFLDDASKVTQTITTSSNTSYRPILLAMEWTNDPSSYSGTTVTDTIYASHKAFIKPNTGDIYTHGNITLKNAGTGDSPQLIFRRGDDTSSYTDWMIFGSGGHLYVEDNNGTNSSWEIRTCFKYNGGINIYSKDWAVATLFRTGVGNSAIAFKNQDSNGNTVSLGYISMDTYSSNGGSYLKRWTADGSASYDVIDTYLFNVTHTTSIGLDNNLTSIGYISGLTAAAWNNNHTDGGLITHYYSANWKTQIYQDYYTGQMAVRGKHGGSWSSWYRVIDEGNANTALNSSLYSSTGTTSISNATLPTGTSYIRIWLKDTSGAKAVFLIGAEAGDYTVLFQNDYQSPSSTAINPTITPVTIGVTAGSSTNQVTITLRQGKSYTITASGNTSASRTVSIIRAVACIV